MAKIRTLPKYVSWAVDRHGKKRLRFRRKVNGVWQSHYLPGQLYDDDFNKAYEAALAQETPIKPEIGVSRTLPGTMSAARFAYLKSARFQSLRPSSKQTFKRIIDRFCEKRGHYRLDRLERKHIQKIINTMSERPQAANRLVSLLRQIFDNAIEMGMMRQNPALNIRKYSQKTKGFHSWTDGEIKQFQDKFEIGTRERLAFDLLLYTGQRRSDIVRMGWQHINSGRLRIWQQKTGAEIDIPLFPKLLESLNSVPRTNMTFIVTSRGSPFTEAGFGNWFRETCNKAGLPHCASHGLRKAFARRLAEAGASANEIMSMTGHQNIQEVTTYTKAASRKRLSDAGMAKVLSTEKEQNVSQPSDKVGIKSGKNK